VNKLDPPTYGDPLEKRKMRKGRSKKIEETEGKETTKEEGLKE
jgi:hypothetical protein